MIMPATSLSSPVGVSTAMSLPLIWNLAELMKALGLPDQFSLAVYRPVGRNLGTWGRFWENRS